MTSFVTLSCPNCGAKLQVTNNVDRFACSYCGKEHLVNRAGGIVSLQPVIDQINEVRQGFESLAVVANRTATASERTSTELALERLKQEKKGLETLGKIGLFALLFGVIAGYAYRNYLLIGGGIVIGGGLVYLWLQSLARITKQEIENRKIVNLK